MNRALENFRRARRLIRAAEKTALLDSGFDATEADTTIRDGRDESGDDSNAFFLAMREHHAR